jgi:DNA invertase Pin-like site-specific DNA recombinase
MMEGKVKFVCCDNPEADETMLHFMAVMAHWERKQISKRTTEALAAAKARGVKLGDYQRIAKAKQAATAARAEAMRGPLEATAHLSATAAADDLNRRGVTTTSGKRWQATQVIRRPCATGPLIAWLEAAGSFFARRAAQPWAHVALPRSVGDFEALNLRKGTA